MKPEGVKVLFRAALSILRINEKLILKAKDFEQLLTFLRCSSLATLDCQHVRATWHS